MTLSEWKSFGVTQEFLGELKRRMDETKEQLVLSAGHNPIVDSFRSGVIAALNDVVNFHFDEEKLEID